jgi:hypothetical protein
MKHPSILVFFVILLLSASTYADDVLRPFILVSDDAGNPAAVDDTRKKLEAGGFEVVGEYSPYTDATVIVATSDELLSAAGKSEFGGYGAVIRTSVTKNGDKTEVAYANPVYWGNAYRMQDLSPVADKLEKALGAGKPFGSENGLTASKLRKYHYMPFMPYFDDHHKLGELDSYKTAVDKVNANLAKGDNGLKKVFEVSIPGKDETLIGVAMSGEGIHTDASIMSKIDVHGARHTAHLPYAVLISGNKVYALAAKFRIALSFPDLSMMGKGSFMEISDVPPVIRDTLATLVE